MAVSRVKTWIAGETLTAADLNAEFNNILDNAADLANPLTKDLDLDGNALILDDDRDTTITADTDDRIDFRLSGADLFRMDGTATTPVNGFDLVGAATGSHPSLTAQGSDTNINAVITPKGSGVVNTAGTLQLGGVLNANAHAVNFVEGSAVASAATTDIWATDGNTVHVTGTTTITSLGTAPNAGAVRWVIFDGVLTLTHGANLNLPGSANITTAAGDFARVYADTTTQLDVQYFKANGKAVVGGSWEQIGTASASNDATVDFTWSKTYQMVMAVVQNAVPATDGQALYLRTTSDATNFDSGASDYAWAVSNVSMATSPTETYLGDDADSEIALKFAIGSGTNEATSGVVEVIGPARTGYTVVASRFAATEATPLDVKTEGMGMRLSAADVDGIRFLFASGNVESGEFAVYGLL